jgi:hypothetical protein
MTSLRAVALVLAFLAAAAAAEPEKKRAAAPKGGPAVKVAGSVVRSKEWIVRRGKTREEEFSGDVRYDAAGTELDSDWALYRQGPNDWQAKGRIRARRVLKTGDVVESSGDKAWYAVGTQKGRLEPAPGTRVPVLHTPPEGGPDHAEGDLLSWEGENVGILTGHARGWGPRGEFWAEEARYDRLPADQSLTLSGNRPVIHDYQGGADAALKGDRIVAYDSPRRAVATGRAQGWIIAQSSSAPKAGPSALLCGQGDRSVGPGPDARVAALLAPPEAARSADGEKGFRDAEIAAFNARICPWGPRVDFWADEADYAQEPARVLTLSGGRPVLHKIDEDQSSALKADRIVAFEDSRRVVATGKVKGWIVFKEDSKPADKSAKKRPEKTK